MHDAVSSQQIAAMETLAAVRTDVGSLFVVRLHVTAQVIPSLVGPIANLAPVDLAMSILRSRWRILTFFRWTLRQWEVVGVHGVHQQLFIRTAR